MREFVGALRQAGFDSFGGYHGKWIAHSGVSEKAAVAREHRLLCEILRLGAQWDQLDVSSSAAFELVVRRLFQIELAVKRNCKMPDFEGLDQLVETALDSSGAVIMPKVQNWLSDQQRDEAFILKQRRLWGEEIAAAAKKKPDPPGGGDGRK